MTCAANNCKNRRSITGSRISYFRFPLSDKERTQKWLAAMKRKNFVPSKTSLLCSEHFDEKCFRINNDRRYLHDNTVPSVFNFDQRPKKRKADARGGGLSEAGGATQTCCARGCREVYVKDGPVTFHSFPTSAARRGRWTLAMGRPDLEADVATSVVCSRHFEAASYVGSDPSRALRADAVPTLFPHDRKKRLKILPDTDQEEEEGSDESASYSAPEYLLDEILPDIKEEPLDLDRDPLGTDPPPPPDFPPGLVWVPADPRSPRLVLYPVDRKDVTGRAVYMPTPTSVEDVAVVTPTEVTPAVAPAPTKKRRAESDAPARGRATKKKVWIEEETKDDEGPLLNMVFVKVEENWDDAEGEPKLSIVETTSLDRPSSEETSWAMRLHPAGDPDNGRPPTPPQRAAESGLAEEDESSRSGSPAAEQSEGEPDSNAVEPSTVEASVPTPTTASTPSADTPGLVLVGPLTHSEETLARLQTLLAEERAKNALLAQQLARERTSRIKFARKLKATEQKLRRLRDKMVAMQLGRGALATPRAVTTPRAVATPVASAIPDATPVAFTIPFTSPMWIKKPVTTRVAATIPVTTAFTRSILITKPVTTPVAVTTAETRSLLIASKPVTTPVAVTSPVTTPIAVTTAETGDWEEDDDFAWNET